MSLIHSESPRVASRLMALAFIVLLVGTAVNRAGAEPLPGDGIEDFRNILYQFRNLNVNTEDPISTDALTRIRHDLREAARRLPSLGDVARVLLLPDWGSTDFSEPDAIVPQDKLEQAVKAPNDETFKRDIESLLKIGKENPAEVTRLIATEIKREVRVSLVERIEQRVRFYVRSNRSADRIAAANLVSDMMTNARKQDNAELPGAGPGIRQAPSLSSRFLRERLRTLIGDMKKLTEDPDPQVEAAGVRALSNIETDATSNVAALKPLLNPSRNVILRRATAGALGHMAELVYLRMDKERPLPTLKSLEQIFPAAASGLADTDAEVRRLSLDACRKAATALEELVPDQRSKLPKGSGLPVYRPMVSAVQKTLPNLNQAARDPVAELRIGACHLLETLALLGQKVRHLEEIPLPPPRPESNEPDKKPGKDASKSKPHSSIRGGRRPIAARSSQWAAARTEQPSRVIQLSPVPMNNEAIAVILDRPVKLTVEKRTQQTDVKDSTMRQAVFVAPKIEDLPAPTQLEVNLKGTVEAMISGLADPDYRVRLASIDVLETFGDRAVSAIPDLVKVLSDDNKFVRWAAARTLGRLAPRQAKQVVPALVRLLNDREDLSVRLAAAFALEQFGPDAKEAVSHLARVINRGDKEYILAILRTLQGIGTDAQPALPAVAWILRNRELPTSVRVEAAQTLGRFGQLARGQIRDLQDAMVNDPDDDVRQAASVAVLSVDRRR